MLYMHDLFCRKNNEISLKMAENEVSQIILWTAFLSTAFKKDHIPFLI